MTGNLPTKPADMAEQKLIALICSNEFPADTNLPPERDLCIQLGVTRPTLREVLQRMGREGWLEIHHGKSTRVKDYLVEGSLSLLGDAARQKPLDPDMISHLLELRLLLAPVYTQKALTSHPEDVLLLIQSLADTPDEPEAAATADWRLHYGLGILSGNPLYALILKGLDGFWQIVLKAIFADPEIRQKHRTTSRMIGKAARANEPEAGEALMRRLMQDTVNGLEQPSL